MITVPLESRHLSVIAAIEAAQIPNLLNLRNLQELASRPAFRGFVAVPDSSADPIAYVLVLAGGGSADIVSVAVVPELLRVGVAKRLLLFALADLAGEGVEEITLVVARCHPGIEWQAIDGRQVHVLFMLVSPMDDPESHLKCLRWIAGLARNTDFRRFLLDAEGENAIRDLLVEMGGDGDEA